MTNRRLLLLTALALCFVAALLRFFRLGDWPFHGDELATLQETASFWQGEAVDARSQIDRLPRLIPLSSLVQQTGYQLFGRDELGSRVLPALLGTLNVLLVFLALDKTLGRVTAVATALLIAVWPEHLYRSQENRYYMLATVLAAACMLAGALAVHKRSALWTVLACLAALAAVLAHTLQGLLLAGLFLGILAAAWKARDRLMAWRLLGIVLGAGVLAAGVFVVYLLPLVRGWNSGEAWGYGPGHSVMAAASQLGWPILLLAALGGVTVWKNGNEQDWYWASWTLLWAGALVVLPLAVAYHPAYVLPLTLGVLVLAGRAIARIYDSLSAQSAPAGYVWLAAACLLNLPSLVSHYSDGSRFDYRTPAEHVSARWQPGDRVATPSATLLKHYAAPGIEPIGIKGTNPLPGLQRLAGTNGGRLWIVIPNSRDGKPEPLRKWLGTHCSQELRACKKRYDYYENATEVYLYVPLAADAAWAKKE